MLHHTYAILVTPVFSSMCFCVFLCSCFHCCFMLSLPWGRDCLRVAPCAAYTVGVVAVTTMRAISALAARSYCIALAKAVNVDMQTSTGCTRHCVTYQSNNRVDMSSNILDMSRSNTERPISTFLLPVYQMYVSASHGYRYRVPWVDSVD